MKLKDYINYRGRGKSAKVNEYNLRTQHFYDGKPMKLPNGVGTVPGIPANFMNSLQIPTNMEIAKAQRDHFIAIHKTKAQKSTLAKLQSLNASGFQKANQMLDAWTLDLISQLERAVNSVVEEKSKLQKIHSTPLSSVSFSGLNLAYSNLKQVFNGIKKQLPVETIDKYFRTLEQYMAKADNHLNQGEYGYLLGKNYYNKDGTTTDFVTKLANLSYQLKGVSLLEHEAIRFIQKHVDLPNDISIMGTGQFFVNGKMASQDALFLPKTLNIVLDSGKTVNFQQYIEKLQHDHGKQVSINLSYNEWDQILRQGAIGLQSKYSQWGNIKMSSISMKDILTTDLQQTKALRMLYILKNQIDIDNRMMVTHPFNVKSSGQAQQDYKRLFSYGLCKFMDQILSHNHYMITKNNQIIDSNTYYRTLFNQGKYFRPGGNISLDKGSLSKNYNVSIKEI